MVVDSTVDRNFRPDSVYRFNPVVSKNTNELKTGAPRRFGLEVSRLGSPMEAKMRRSSFGDAGWADHAVLDVQRHLRVHPTSFLWCSPIQASQRTLAFKRGVATLPRVFPAFVLGFRSVGDLQHHQIPIARRPPHETHPSAWTLRQAPSARPVPKLGPFEIDHKSAA